MIKIITDSAADVPKEEQERYGIRVLSVPITVDGVTYREGVDVTSAQYYDLLLGAKELPTTSQITMMEFFEAFRQSLEEGCRQIICVTITAAGSGIYNAACLARQMIFEEQPAVTEAVTIDVVDSGSYTYDYGHAVVAGARAAQEGKDRAQVLEAIRLARQSYQVYFAMTNLDFAKKSGRITSAAAFIGEVLGFRPILTIRDGGTQTISKVRGDHKIIPALVEKFRQRASGDDRGFYIVHAKDLAMAKELKKRLEQETKRKCLGFYPIGASVTTNAGPTVFGVIVPVDQAE